MKVTALIPNDLIHEVKNLTNGKNITDSLITALQEWISIQKLNRLGDRIQKKPINFQKGFSAEKIRTLNRTT